MARYIILRSVGGRILLVGAVFTMATVGLLVPFTPPANPDISWLAYSAGRYLHGATPYVDLIEINPPAILFFNLPPAWIADVFGWGPTLTYTVYVALLSVFSVAATRRLLGELFPEQQVARDLICALLVLAIFTFSGRHFGQREHVMLALVLPYLVTAAIRISGAPVPLAASIGVGCLAGVGLSLKPHFLVVWFAVEALVWLRSNSGFRALIRPETAVIGSVLVLYAISIAVITPTFLPMVDALGRAYLGYLNGSFADHISQPAVLFTGIALVAVLLVRPARGWSEIASVLGVAAPAMLLIAVMQRKGWAYHYYPAFAMATVLMGLVMFGAGSTGNRARVLTAKIAASATILIGVSGAMLSVRGIITESKDRGRGLAHVVAKIEARCGTSPALAVLSPDAESAFPLVTRSEFRSVMPISSLWPLSAAYERRLRTEGGLKWRTPASATAAERFVREAVIEALIENPPDLILVDKAASERAFGAGGFGYIPYLERDARFREMMFGYRRANSVSAYQVYVQVNSGECRL